MQQTLFAQSIDLQATQKQALSINQQTLQSLNVLSFTQEELEAWLQEEIEKNPLVDLQDLSNVNGEKTFERNSNLRGNLNQVSNEIVDSKKLIESIKQKKSLKKMLYEIKEAENLSDEINLSLNIIIDSLDNDGYFRKNTNILSQIFSIDEKIIVEAIATLQKISPPGIAARTLEECLSIQLENKNGSISTTEKKFINNIRLIANGDINKLKKICNISHNEFIEIYNSIKKLNPKPGYQYSNEQANYIIPDLILHTKSNESLTLEINEIIIPSILLNEKFYIEIKGKAKNKEDIDFINNCYQAGRSLIQNIQQRYETTLGVAHLIIEYQRDYFLKGTPLKPLLQKEIADFLKIHESTVSRAIRGRYLLSPLGMHPLSHFIVHASGSTAGNSNLSSHAVKQKIKEAIRNENKKKPFSDNDISKQLISDGIQIARRTVAKYREEMKIPNAANRKKLHMISCI